MFLERSCDDDSTLRHQVRSLLEAEARAGSFLACGEAGEDTPLPSRVPCSSHATQSAAKPRSLGCYRLERRIGRGATSIVYSAVRADGEYASRVAIKVLRSGLDCAELVRRFCAERKILASLDHPYIARVLDGGTTGDGVPYLVMELVDGMPVDEHCDRHRLTVEERLVLFRRICAAVHHAHGKLVIHRDLKPSNILVTATGEPKLLDFGIAKLANTSLTYNVSPPTATGMRALTPSYASPEQLRGEAATRSSDVYALGVILYKLLAGRLPHDLGDNDLATILRMVAHEAPRPSRVVDILPAEVCRARSASRPALKRRLRGDLDWIVGQAIASMPRDRYASVEQLADDLRRHLDGVPARVRDARLARLRRFMHRRSMPLAAGLGTLILGALISGALAFVSFLRAGSMADNVIGTAYPTSAQAPHWCVPDGGVDDTLNRTDCCSGVAVGGSTVCLNERDWGTSWQSCAQFCGSRLAGSCVPSGGIDDTLGRTDCCSRRAVHGSTRCLNPADYGSSWRTCVQTCA